MSQTRPNGQATRMGAIRDDLGHEWRPRGRFWFCILCRCEIASTRMPCPRRSKPSAEPPPGNAKALRPDPHPATSRSETVQPKPKGGGNGAHCAYCGRDSTGPGAICCSADRMPPADTRAFATNPELIRIVVGAATKLADGRLCWHEQGSYETMSGRHRCRGCGSTIIGPAG